MGDGDCLQHPEKGMIRSSTSLNECDGNQNSYLNERTEYMGEKEIKTVLVHSGTTEYTQEHFSCSARFI
jgi:hypothetical protein